MQNFATLVGHLTKGGAAVQVADAAALEAKIRNLLADAAKRISLGERARSALATHAGATERTCDAVHVP